MKLKRISSVLLMCILLATTTIAVYAANFTPSAEAKPAPDVVPVLDSTNKEVAAEIKDAENKPVLSVPIGDLIVTPISEAKQADEDIRTLLESAYSDITTKKLLEMDPEIPNFLKSSNPDINIDDLRVSHVIDVTVRGTYREYLSVPGNTITIIFDAEIPKSSFLMIMMNADIENGGKWETIPLDHIIRNADGTISVIFDNLCPVLFITDEGLFSIDSKGPDSPQTGEASNQGVKIAVILVVLLMTSAGSLFYWKKRGNIKNR